MDRLTRSNTGWGFDCEDANAEMAIDRGVRLVQRRSALAAAALEPPEGRERDINIEVLAKLLFGEDDFEAWVENAAGPYMPTSPTEHCIS
jgi:hypothetical protein